MLALSVAGCAQDSKSVVISVGRGLNMLSDENKPSGHEAKEYAAFYLQYARMARLAYVDEQYRLPNGCPDLTKLNDGALAKGGDQRAKHARLHTHLTELRNERSGWICRQGWYGEAPYGYHNEPAPGFAAYVWTKGCHVVVAFRGTDYKELADWQANLRALLPFVAAKDQYDHVQNSIEHIVSYAGCSRPRVMMTGHSLGGGLAQAAGYSYPGTEYVIAFDSSPVTSLAELPEPFARKNQEHLAIDRVYEVGEILQGVRYVMHGFAAPRLCHPRVRLVRFNSVPGFNPLGQHGMEVLINSFVTLSGNRPATPEIVRRVSGRKRAVECDFTREVFRDNSTVYPEFSLRR